MSYLGSKAASGAYQNIIALMPPHDTYIEAFLGTGTVLKRKPPAQTDIGIDLCADAMRKFDYPDHAQVFRADAFEFLRSFDYHAAGRVLIYADPPYLPETRTSQARYKKELTRAQHIELLELLSSLPANVSVMLSGYPSDLYDESLPAWHKHIYQVMSRGGVRTEVIWHNFVQNAKHWATYAGKDRSDRQRIGRLAARWAKNYQNMSEAERLAVMAKLMEVHQVEYIS